MKNGFILVICIGLNLPAFTQENEAITSAGDFDKNGNGSISWTLGDLSIGTYSLQNITIAEGFQLGLSEDIITAIRKQSDLQILVYPNPTESHISIQVDTKEKLSYRLFDLTGRTMIEEFNTLPETAISLDNLQPGIYLLEVKNDISILKILKIIKK
ncbi:MAG: T9SS type A sorting domain-containing protein [Bacteroidota bacterium]